MWSLCMLFEGYRGTSKFINSVWHTKGLYQQFISSGILIVLEDPRFKSCERIYTIDVSFFLKIKSLDRYVEVYQILA